MRKKGPRTLPAKGPYSNNSGVRGGLRLHGLEKMLDNLRKESAEIYNKSIAGMYKGAMLILREATIKCPIDLGNLRASGFVMGNGAKVKGVRVKRKKGTSPRFVEERASSKTKKPGIAARMSADHQQVISKHERATDKAFNPMVVIGFSAYYAVYVHEDPWSYHTKGQYKFLYLAMQENTAKVLSMITEEAKL